MGRGPFPAFLAPCRTSSFRQTLTLRHQARGGGAGGSHACWLCVNPRQHMRFKGCGCGIDIHEKFEVMKIDGRGGVHWSPQTTGFAGRSPSFFGGGSAGSKQVSEQDGSVVEAACHVRRRVLRGRQEWSGEEPAAATRDWPCAYQGAAGALFPLRALPTHDGSS